VLKILNVEPARHDAPARVAVERIAAVDYRDCPDQAALAAALSSRPYDALVTRLGLLIDERALEACPTLRYVATPTTGLDHIDVEGLAAHGVSTLSLRGETEFLETVSATAEHAWALLLASRRRLTAAHGDVLDGEWRRDPFIGRELKGATLGIVGLGRLGRMVARYGLAFGMQVLAHDLDPDAFRRAPVSVVPTDPETLLARSDIVSLHLPLTPDTRLWLNEARIAVMKADATLINTARGELVDEPALLERLAAGRMAAALDVLSGDGSWDGGVPLGHPLVAYATTARNLLLSPHIGGYAERAIADSRRFIALKLASALERSRTKEAQ
jgi:D-3-phosphoglycerate dehydrogenase